MAANGASRSGNSKPKGFKNSGEGKWPTVEVKPGEYNKVQLKNIQQLSMDQMGGNTKLSKTKTVKPDRGQGQLNNLKDWGAGKVKPGDNPYRNGK